MVKEKAYAKVNLFLNVVGKRLDGYHDLEMIMAPIKLFDTLRFQEIEENDIKVTSTTPITDNIEDNLVFKIAHVMKEEFNISSGIHIHIEKRIPIGAGLGGGSADAAATLRGLNRLWNLKLTEEDMAKIGLEFGADIPFCVYNKLAKASSKGEELVFIDQKIKGYILVITPNIHVSTKEIFTNLDFTKTNETKILPIYNAIKSKRYEEIIANLYNRLEEVTFKLYPSIKSLKFNLIENGLMGTLMSGSGSSVFSLSKRKKELKRGMSLIKENEKAFLTKFK